MKYYIRFKQGWLIFLPRLLSRSLPSVALIPSSNAYDDFVSKTINANQNNKYKTISNEKTIMARHLFDEKKMDRQLFIKDDECIMKCQLIDSAVNYRYSNQSRHHQKNYSLRQFRKLEEQQNEDMNNVTQENETGSNVGGIPFYLQIILIILLVLLSGLFSGLTLGLMSLDKTGLEIVMEGDDPIAAKNAKAIYPIRSNGNLLLTTLYVPNIITNDTIVIFLQNSFFF